ncbi:TPA: prophage tail fiber N-terminal domain-containing protein [Salmonella enterica subsp. enterica serovar Reading]
MTIISGILKDRQGTVLAQASLTLTETDSKQTVITSTDNTGHYYIQLSPGTWRVTLGRGDAPPKDAGVIAITKDTAPGALDDYIASLQPSTLDIQVLGFMRGLVDEAERASEATSQAKQFADAARQGAQQAEQALKAAQEIAKTPGPKGDKGDPGPQGIPGRDGYQGKDGKSAYDAWASQQPAGSDTSMTAFMTYLKAIPGPQGIPGKDGAPGKDGKDGQSAYEIWVSQQPAGSDTSMSAYMTYQKGKDGAPGKSSGEYHGVLDSEHYISHVGTEEGTWLMRSGGFADAPPENISEDAILSNIYAPGAVDGDEGVQVFMSPTALNFRQVFKGQSTYGEWLPVRSSLMQPYDVGRYTTLNSAIPHYIGEDIDGSDFSQAGTWRVMGEILTAFDSTNSGKHQLSCYLILRIQ